MPKHASKVDKKSAVSEVEIESEDEVVFEKASEGRKKSTPAEGKKSGTKKEVKFQAEVEKNSLRSSRAEEVAGSIYGVSATSQPPPTITRNMNHPLREVLSQIKTVTYGVLTEGEIVAMAACEVFLPSNKGSASLENTPYDPRLGALDNADVCQYCDNKNKQCPGHFGYIRLAYPVYNPRHIDTVLSILKCICAQCAEPRISKDVAGPMLSSKGFARLKLYKKHASALKNCSSCQAALYSFFRDKSSLKMFQNDKKNAIQLSAAEARSILLKVSDETMELLGFNGNLSQNPVYLDERIELRDGKTHPHQLKPEALIYTVLIVPPTCMRPWVVRNGAHLDDDLTDLFNTLTKLNNKLLLDRDSPGYYTSTTAVGGKKKGNGKLSENERTKLIEDFGNKVWAISDTPAEKSNKNNSRKQKGLCDRISKGKKSHLEDYVRGKRSDHTARDVIVGADAEIPPDSVGIDEETARILTKPETVLSFNYDILTKLLEEGKITTVDRGGHTIFVSEVTKKGTLPFSWGGKIGLQPYDTVHRQLRDGDWVILNRQPSLRIESMQAVRVKIIRFPAKPSRSDGRQMNMVPLSLGGSRSGTLLSVGTNLEEHPIRMQLFQTGSYNADFDGDEMNIHVPQSISATTEIATMSRTACHIISAQNSAPIIGPVQNTLLYCYYLSETFDTPEELDLEANPNYTFSLPEGGTVPGFMTMVTREDFMDAVMTARIPQDRYENFITRAQEFYPAYFEPEPKKKKSTPSVPSRKLKKYLPGKLALSIVFPKTFSWKRKTGNNKYLPVVEIQKGILTPNSGPLCKKCIGATAGSTLHPLWKMAPDLSLQVMWELQALVSIFIVRMGFSMGVSDCLTTPEGQLLKKRTLAEVLIKCEMIADDIDRSPEEKERDTNSALNQSMNIAPILAKEHMLKGRRNALSVMANAGAKGSTTNSSMVTAFVGQQNIEGRRPNLAISRGQRSSTHFLPGDKSPMARGFVPYSYMEGLTPAGTWFHAASGRRGVVDTALKTADSGYLQKKLTVFEGDISIHHDGTARDANMSIVQFAYGADGFSAKEMIRTENLPDQLFYTDPHFVANVLNLEAEYREADFGEPPGKKRPLTTEEISTMLSYIQAGIPGVQTEVTERITFNMRVLTRAAIVGVELYESKIVEFCEKIRDDFEEAKAKRGYMAGLVGSSAIGEPTTQMTLNTFHHAGQSAKDVTLGVPRLKECLGATHKPSKPSCVIYEDKNFSYPHPYSKSETENERDARREVLRKLIEKQKSRAEKTKKAREAEPQTIKEYEAELEKLDKTSLLEASLFSKPFANLTVKFFIKTSELQYLPADSGASRESSPVGLLTYEEYEKRWWVKLNEDLGNIPEIEPNGWVILLKLDMEKLYDYKITPDMIAEKIQEESSGNKGTTMCCVASPDVLGEIEVYLNFSDITSYVRSKTELPDYCESHSKIPSRNLLSTENIDYFSAREVAMSIIEKTPVQGIMGISKTYVRLDAVAKEWVIDSQGTNLSVILATPGVDGTRTISDDMWEILRVFGIEAARSFLIKEITGILSFDGTFINRRHPQLLVDVMTRTGTITGVSRDGISRDVGPIAKGIFEKAVENFTEAATFGEHDKMKGVASSIMFGTTALAGTGTVEIKDVPCERIYPTDHVMKTEAKKPRASVKIPVGRGKK